MNLSWAYHLPLLLLLAQLIRRGCSLKCYHCSNKYGPCNSGECMGGSCVKVEATANNKLSVQKGCLSGWVKPTCIKTDFLGVEALKCTCATDLCNGDTELSNSGLVTDGKVTLNSLSPVNPERSKRTNDASLRTLAWSPCKELRKPPGTNPNSLWLACRPPK